MGAVCPCRHRRGLRACTSRLLQEPSSSSHCPQAFINSKLMELQRARELATKATGLVSDMPRNPSPDLQQMESRVVKIVDLEREINAEIDELVDLKRDIRELIAQIRKPEYRTLLELRYLGFRTWDAIAEKMGFEPRTIYRFHSNALRVVERLMCAEKNS